MAFLVGVPDQAMTVGVAIPGEAGELRRDGGSPVSKAAGGGLVEGGEFGMTEDGGFDFVQR